VRALITGEKGYIGTRLCAYLNDNGVPASRISVRNGVIPDDFIKCGVLIHAAALVHQTDKNIPYEKYYAINAALTQQIAETAAGCGVKHFVFFSTMAVFEGLKSQNGAYINDKTDVSFYSPYASTKYGAEELLREYADDMIISVVRPPLVYGKGSPGNFKRLINISKKIPAFPNADNRRSMIYIDNLCELVRLIIINKTPGYFHPQNAYRMNIPELVRDLGRLQNNDVRLVDLPAPVIKLFKTHSYGKKLFGTFAYDSKISACFDDAYNVVSHAESLARTV